MLKSLKRAAAALSVLALLMSNIHVAFAQTFTDVATDAWYYDYVEQLVNDGVVDAGNSFRPNDALNRAELVKMAVTAVDGLADYEAPASPTFDDVATDAWYYDYVEAAVQLGIVSGYTDASGNLTGKFGPGDTVNRAAATKILVNAFAVPTTLTPAAPFGDVSSSAWYYDYVTTAYNQSILDGYANGNFGPSDPVTRAQVAKLIVNSQNPVLRSTSTGEGEGTTTTTSTGALEVSLNDNTPASSTIPQSASSVQLVSFDFTAADDDVTITNLVVTRGGVGKVGDWDSLYLYDGAKRITTGRSINSDTNTSTFPLNLTVDAGTTMTLTVVGDVASTGVGASNQHYFYVASSADVTSNAASTAGDFPVAGNTFTMGGSTTSVNTVTVAAGTTPSQPTIGQTDAEVAAFKLTAGATNDIAVHSVALTQAGSLSTDKLDNCRLLRSTDEVATADGFENDRVTFVLDTPYVVPKGQNKTFYVRCDINGGRSTDTVKLYLDEKTDLVAIDQQYGYGAVVTNNFTSGSAANLTLKGGAVTVADNGPAAHQVAQNTTNVELLNFSLSADRDLTVQNTFVDVTISNTAGTGPSISTNTSDTIITDAAGTLASMPNDGTPSGGTGTSATIAVGDMVQIVTGSDTYYCIATSLGTADPFTTNCSSSVVVAINSVVTEVNPYDYVKNVRIVDLDSGSTLAGPSTDANDGATLVTVPPDHYTKLYTEDYELTGGETRHLSVQADINTNMAAGYQIKAAVRYSDATGPDSYLKDLNANEFIAMNDVVGAGPTLLTGKNMTTATNSLTVAAASTPTSQTYVKGDAAVPALGIAFTAGDAGDIKVKRVIVRAYADSATVSPMGSATGDIAANTLVSSISLYDGNDLVAGPKSLSLVDTTPTGYTLDQDYYKAQFDDLNLTVSKGGTKTLTAKLNLLNTASSTLTLALDVVPGSDITAEDSDANTITPTGSALNGAAAHSPLLTIVTSGSLTASSEGNPNAAALVAGATNQLVSKYRFHALRESFDVNKLTVLNDTDGGTFDSVGATSAVSQVTIKYPDVNGVTQTKSATLTGGSATISGLDFHVPAGEDAFVEVYANVSTMAGVGASLSGKSFRLGIQEANSVSTFEAVGSSSSTTLNFTAGTEITNGTSVNGFVVRKSVPTFAKASGGSTNLISGENTLFGLTVTADAAGSVSFGRLVFDVTPSGLTGTSDEVSTFRFYKGSSLINTTNVNIYGIGATSTVDLSSGGLAACNTGAAGVEGETYKVVVSFNQEETVSAGSSTTYYLKATVAGVAGSSDSITTRLATGDEATVVSGLTTNNGNDNTGSVWGATTNIGLFTTAGAAPCGTAVGADGFAKVAGTVCNVVWSDKSSDTHLYPTVTAGTVSAAGSTDFTNGYLLKVTELTSSTLSGN